jgi:hypothetical protein
MTIITIAATQSYSGTLLRQPPCTPLSLHVSKFTQYMCTTDHLPLSSTTSPFAEYPLLLMHSVSPAYFHLPHHPFTPHSIPSIPICLPHHPNLHFQYPNTILTYCPFTAAPPAMNLTYDMLRATITVAEQYPSTGCTLHLSCKYVLHHHPRLHIYFAIWCICWIFSSLLVVLLHSLVVRHPM